MVRRPKLSVSDVIKVSTWVASHRDEVANNSRSSVARSIKADLGLDISLPTLAEFEVEAGVSRIRGAAGTTGRKDRPHILAKELVRVMVDLGFVPSAELQDIANHQ